MAAQRTTCPMLSIRFARGPCGANVRYSSPSVSAIAPQEQIQPQYAPFPQK